jgi:hypothetical protein
MNSGSPLYELHSNENKGIFVRDGTRHVQTQTFILINVISALESLGSGGWFCRTLYGEGTRGFRRPNH